MIYLSSVLIFGLLQVWILFGYLTMKQVSFESFDLIRDGGLFFFASSLAITSYLNHRKVFKRAQTDETYWSFLFVAIILIICILGYITAININTVGTRTNFEINLNGTQNLAQIMSSLLALFYGFLTEKRVEKAIR